MFRKACVCAINMWLPKLFVKKGVVTVQQIVKQKGLLWFLDFCWPFWGRKFIVSLTERSSNFDGGILSEKMQVSGFERAMIKSTDESKWNESGNIMKHQSNIMTDDDRWIACRNCSFQGTILGHDRSEPSLRVPAAYGHQCVDWLLCIPVFPFWNHKISKSGDPPKIHQLGFSWKLMDNWIMLFGLFLVNFSKSAQAVFFPENLLLSIHIVIPFSFPLCGEFFQHQHRSWRRPVFPESHGDPNWSQWSDLRILEASKWWSDLCLPSYSNIPRTACRFCHMVPRIVRTCPGGGSANQLIVVQ